MPPAIELEHLRRVEDVLETLRRAMPKESRREARAEGDAIYVEHVGSSRYPLVRLHRVDDDGWLVEDQRPEHGHLVWASVMREPTSLESVLRRWDDPWTCHRDLRVPSMLPESVGPPRTEPPPRMNAAEKKRKRAELEGCLADQEAWLIEQFRKISSYDPPHALRRMHLEWHPGGPLDEFSIRGWGVDRDGDYDDHLDGPAFTKGRLASRALSNELNKFDDGDKLVQECLERWFVDVFRRLAPTLSFPVYLSAHDSLESGLNLATGRRATFRLA